MLVTWSALELVDPLAEVPWRPGGATWWQAGAAGPGTASIPSTAGAWWTVLAVWDDAGKAARTPQAPGVRAAWHVVLEPVGFRGDAVLSGGSRPFAALGEGGRVTGAAAVVTLAGLGQDAARTTEFLERFVALGQDVRDAPGHRASLVMAPADGALLTFSAWTSLRDAVSWAYQRPQHRATVDRQQEHALLATSGFLRCAVLASSGTLHGTDPLAGLTGSVA